MIQAEKYGTPLARAFKVLSQEQRTERMLRAEEKAGRLPATMTVPMMLFILPALFIVLIGPAILDIMDNFIGMATVDFSVRLDRSGSYRRLRAGCSLEAVLWLARTGAPWRDLPGRFGKWNTVFQRFRRWVKGGVFERVFAACPASPDFEYALIDGTHRHRPPQGEWRKGGPKARPSGARVAA